MTRLREILRDRKGNGFPLAIAITLALVIIFCGISEYIRLLIIAQGVRDAMQTAVISTVNDNLTMCIMVSGKATLGGISRWPEILRNLWTMVIFMVDWRRYWA